MNYTKIENEVYNVVLSILKDFDRKFLVKGISYTVDLKKEAEDSSIYNSEIEINFNKDGKFYDTIEFLIYHHGNLFVNTKGLEEALKHDFEDVLSRN